MFILKTERTQFPNFKDLSKKMGKTKQKEKDTKKRKSSDDFDNSEEVGDPPKRGKIKGKDRDKTRSASLSLTKETKKRLPQQNKSMDSKVNGSLVISQLGNTSSNSDSNNNATIVGFSSQNDRVSRIKSMMGKELNNSITPGSKSILQAKRSLFEKLDKIDEEFQMPGKDLNAKGTAEGVLAPDGIRIGVDQDEDDEFQEELDYEGDGDKTIYPIPQDEDSEEFEDDVIDAEAETIAGEDTFNDSISSSTIITFKKPVNKNPLINSIGKPVEEMTPEELVEVNPALRALMQKLLDKSDSNKPMSDKRKVVKSNGKGTKHMRTNEGGLIKSPSDTTIYAPALKLAPVPTNEPDLMIRDENNDKPNSKVRQEIGSELMKNINSFLEQVRIEATPED